MLVAVNLVNGTDDSMDHIIYATTLEVPDGTDLKALGEELTNEFYAYAIASTSEQFRKENAVALRDVNFLHWVTVSPIEAKAMTREEFLNAAKNSMLDYGYPTVEENIGMYL